MKNGFEKVEYDGKVSGSDTVTIASKIDILEGLRKQISIAIAFDETFLPENTDKEPHRKCTAVSRPYFCAVHRRKRESMRGSAN